MEDKTAKLSQSLLDMKFMKKTKERVDKEQDDAQGQAMYSKEISDKMKEEGRLSFGGMNPDIENIMKQGYNKKLEEAEQKKEKDVTDAEMAKEYSSLVNTVGKRFKTKRQRENKKFQKPPEMDTI